MRVPLTSRKSTPRVEISERRKTYRPLMALIDESTGDKPRGRLFCFHSNFYPLGGWVPFRGQMANARSLSLLRSLPSLPPFLCDSARRGCARQAMEGGEIDRND